MTPFVTLPHGFAMRVGSLLRRPSAQCRCQVSIFARSNSISIAIVQCFYERVSSLPTEADAVSTMMTLSC
jgi:hypothetical protein